MAGIAAAVCLLVPLAQYFFRRFDDNNFASWDWIFRVVNPAQYTLSLVFIFILVLVAVAFSAFAFTLPFRLRNAALFFACFISAAVLWGAPEANIDTSRYFMQAKHLELYGVDFFLREWGAGIPAWTDLPAVPFFYGILFKLFGESRIFIQLFTAVLFATTALLTSLIGRTLWDEETGWRAGALLLGMPFLLVQTSLMLVDVPTMFFLTLSIWAFLRAIERGGTGRAFTAAFSIAVAALCKYSAWPMLSVLPVIAIIDSLGSGGANRPALFRRGLGIVLISFLLIGSAVWLKFDSVSEQFKLLMDFQRTGLDRWGESYASTFLFQIHPIIAVAAVASLVAAALKRDVKYVIVLWLPFLIVLFQIKRVRYTIPVFPMLALMAAYGLQSVRGREYRRMMTTCVVATSLAATFFLYLPFLDQWSSINLQRAGELLDRLNIDAVEVFTLPQKNYPINPAVAVPLLDLSTRKRIIYQYAQGASTPDEDVTVSRYRFSWEYRNPAYYAADAHDATLNKAVLLISGSARDKIPPELADVIGGLKSSATFTTFNPLFQYRTLVRIYWK